MKNIILIITLTLILTGCNHSSEVKPMNSPKITESTSLQPTISNPVSTDTTPIPSIKYIEDKQYIDPIQNNLIKIINENATAINNRNKTKFLSTFTYGNSENSEHLESMYKYMVDIANEFIIKMESIQFIPDTNGSTEYAVTLLRTIYLKNTNETKVETSTYYFKKVNNQLLLFGID